MMVVAAEEIPLPAQPDPRNRRPVAFRFARPRPATAHFRPMELHITGLSKTYANGVRALDEVSLSIPTGMFGLLGPNGAGKSTLMRTLATLQDADHGSAQLVDAERGTHIDVLRDKAGVRRVLGYLPQDFGVYPKVTAEDMLDHLARLKGLVGPQRAQARGRDAAAPDQPVRGAQEGARRLLRRHAAALRHRPGAARRPQADHRRRADRRPRPRGAHALSQPAGRDRRGRDRPALDAHRLRRQRPLPAAGDHEQGAAAHQRHAEAADRRARRPHLGSLGRAGPTCAALRERLQGHLDPALHRQDDAST